MLTGTVVLSSFLKYLAKIYLKYPEIRALLVLLSYDYDYVTGLDRLLIMPRKRLQ